MSLPHMDCTSPERRCQICNDYEVHADDCITIYGNRIVISDAKHHPITDRYYQFSVFEKGNTKPSYVITCGSGAARHFCSLIDEPLPRSFNPYVQEQGQVVQIHNDNGNIPNEIVVQWNPIRRQLYNAVQLFIIRYQEILQPGTSIFKISQKLCQNNTQYVPYESYFRGFSTIVDKFHTNIPSIINDLAEYGHVREFDFDAINTYMRNELNCDDNIFCEDHFT